MSAHATIENPVSKQRIDKHTTVEVLLEVVLSILFVRGGYKEEFSG
jgi:hypothetical protein